MVSTSLLRQLDRTDKLVAFVMRLRAPDSPATGAKTLRTLLDRASRFNRANGFATTSEPLRLFSALVRHMGHDDPGWRSPAALEVLDTLDQLAGLCESENIFFSSAEPSLLVETVETEAARLGRPSAVRAEFVARSGWCPTWPFL